MRANLGLPVPQQIDVRLLQVLGRLVDIVDLQIEKRCQGGSVGRCDALITLVRGPGDKKGPVAVNESVHEPYGSRFLTCKLKGC